MLTLVVILEWLWNSKRRCLLYCSLRGRLCDNKHPVGIHPLLPGSHHPLLLSMFGSYGHQIRHRVDLHSGR